MAYKKTTIVFLPEGIKTVKQYNLPKFLIKIFFFLFFCAAGFITWIFVDYYQVKKQLPERVQLMRENSRQRMRLAALAKKIDQLRQKMDELKEVDDRLKGMVNLEPEEETTQFLGVGGSDPGLMNPESSLQKVHQKTLPLMHPSLDNLDKEISIQTLEKADLYHFLKERKSIFACTPSIRPARGMVTSKFGYRKSAFTGEKEFHHGLDISAREGQPITAPSDGVVSAVENMTGYGNALTISHGHGIKTRYGHLSKVLVKKGESVKRGQKIALMGNTGRSTGPHVHYEVLLKGVPVNPERYIHN